MFRVSNRLLRSELFKNGTCCKTVVRVASTQFGVVDVTPRYLSHASLSSSGGNYSKHFPPLYSPLPELKLPPCMSGHVKQFPTQVTVLQNGLRIASEDSVGPGSCIGLFVDCGSIYEERESTGSTHLLERIAFNSTKNRSQLRIVREVEASGGNLGASASREHMGYSYDVLRSYMPEAVELLIDCVRNPVFLEHEVKAQLTILKEEMNEADKDPQQFLLESLHLTGYSGALANPLRAPKSVLDIIDGSVIEKFYYENYTADRMVLAAYGVDHEQLLAVAEPLLHDMKSGPPMVSPKSTYVGSDFRHQAHSEKTHVAIAFEVPGGWHDEKAATILTVLQTLMGGGGSFSAGGPGKGMHSRLYLRVLNKYQEVQSFSAFSSVCNDTGLFGIHSTTGSDFVGKAVDIAAEELIAIATPGQLTEVEVYRAKNATKSAILTNLESRAIVTDDIGRQILTYGCRKPVEHFLGILEEVTLNDITMMAQKILSSPPTMACWGDVGRVPSYDHVCQRFHA